jgi:putative N6-adenine-specific DNA methylase
VKLFASTAPGLEPIALAEIHALGVKATMVSGGVECEGDRDVALRMLIELRTVSHVLVRVATFRADRFDRLEKEVRAIDWRAWLLPGAPRKLRATAEKSRLYHTGAITERLARWIDEAVPPGDGEPIAIAARLVRDECTLSIDLSGEPLHRRGYRLDPGKAPLREDIAAALVIASGWDRECPLIDPMCGSGTIAIEAAMIGANVAPNLERGFAIERTRLATVKDRDRVRAIARSHRRTQPRVVASDRDREAVARTKANGERAGVALELSVAPLSSVDTSTLAGATVVTNPPWGERLAERGAGLDRLHAALGDLVRAIDGRLAVAAYDTRLARAVGVPLTSAFLTDAGGKKVHAMIGRGS